MAMKENIYSLAFRNKYDMMASEASKEVFLAVINNNYFYKAFPKYNMDIFLNVKRIEDNSIAPKKFNIEAKNDSEFDKDELIWSEISLNIILSRSFTNMDHESLNYAIYEAIRHELEHHKTFTEIGKPDSKYKNILEKVFNVSQKEAYKNCGIIAQYITHPQELSSNARSIYFVAKKEHRDYRIVLEEFLNRVFFNNDPEKIKIGKMDKDISDIIKSVRNKIIERMMYFFPNTKKAISKSKMTKITMESLW